MSDTPKISDEVAILARDFIQGVAAGTVILGKGEQARFRAAEVLYRAYQTQDRYSLQRIKELANTTNASQNVREYEDLTDEALNAKVVAIRQGVKTG